MPIATTTMGALVALGGIAWGADLYRMVGWNFLAEQFLAIAESLKSALLLSKVLPSQFNFLRSTLLFNIKLFMTSLQLNATSAKNIYCAFE